MVGATAATVATKRDAGVGLAAALEAGVCCNAADGGATITALTLNGDGALDGGGVTDATCWVTARAGIAICAASVGEGFVGFVALS